MHIWQLQEAKAKLTQLIKQAKKEPQMISRHGVPEIVVLSLVKYEELISKSENIVEFFQQSPLKGVDLEMTRDNSGNREVDL